MFKTGSPKQRRLRDLKFAVATRMLDHIGVSMYSTYPKAISEIVVNGYDADANYVSVNICPDRDEIIIQDNGEGMDEQDIREGYMFLGSGQKRAVKRTLIYHRLPIGNKGIGKLAGLGIARRMEIRTIKNGKGYEFCIDREELERSERMGKLREAVLDRAPIKLQGFDAKGEPNGTVVTLRRLRPECGKLDVGKVIAHLAHELPLGKDFHVVVNGQTCEPKHIPARKRIPVDYMDPICGVIKGEIIVATTMLRTPGIFTTVRGRVVGKPSFFTLSPTSFKYHVADLITGMVEVPGFDPEEETQEMVIKTDREGFVETHPRYQAYSAYMTKLISDVCKELEKEYLERAEAEKKAKVDKAIKQVAKDFNAYEESRKRLAGQDSILKGEERAGGEKRQRPDLHIKTKRRLRRKGPKSKIPPSIMREIEAILGSGRLRFKNQTYQIKTWALGEDFPECDIRPNQSLIVINLDHPAYEQGVKEKATEITVFRAIAAAFALQESNSPREMYEQLDDMIRFQAKRMEERRAKKSVALEEEVALTPAE